MDICGDSQLAEVEANQLLACLSAGIASTWLCLYLWRRRKLYYHSWNIPGPLNLPFIGVAHLFMGSTTDILDNLLEMQKQYPDYFKVWFGPTLVYVFSDPVHIEKILTNPKSLNKADFYEFFSEAFGDGLFTSKVDKWRKHRRIIMPAFSQRVLVSFVEISAERSEVFADKLHALVGSTDLDLSKMSNSCALDIICETAMGVKMNFQTSDCDFAHAMDKMLEIVTYRIFHIWHHIGITRMLFPINWKFKKYEKIFRGVISEVVNRKMKEFETAKNNTGGTFIVSTIEEDETRKKSAFLDLILENSDFTEKELIEEVQIFMMAGTDTTASAICSIMTMLGMHQEIQQNVYDEIVEIMGPERRVQPSDLPEMKYTERVIKESLRLFPAGAIILRKIGGDIDLGDFVVPDGAIGGINLIHVHRNPKYWPDPLKFDPDRFLPENVTKRHPCTHISFSFGPRNCIGGRFAMMTMKTILANTLRRVKVFTEYKRVEDIKLTSNVVVRMKDGSKVWVETR